MVSRLPEKWSGLENILDPERKPGCGKELGRRIILEIFFEAKKKRAEHLLELRIRDLEREKTLEIPAKDSNPDSPWWSEMNAVGKLRSTQTRVLTRRGYVGNSLRDLHEKACITAPQLRSNFWCLLGVFLLAWTFRLALIVSSTPNCLAAWPDEIEPFDLAFKKERTKCGHRPPYSLGTYSPIRKMSKMRQGNAVRRGSGDRERSRRNHRRYGDSSRSMHAMWIHSKLISD